MTKATVNCPLCKDSPLDISISPEWLYFTETPAFCKACDKVVWLRISEDTTAFYLEEDDIPPIELGFKVRVIDEHSVLYGKEGYVVDKDHIHYRVKSGRVLVWVPEHWVERV